MHSISRKTFLKTASLLVSAPLLTGSAMANSHRKDAKKMKLGLVTYLWGKDWDVPTLIKHCTDTGLQGIELRVDHARGVKVKPNAFHRDVPRKKTMAQIGSSLNELAAYAADFGQQLRLEVHGEETQELPNIKIIMDHADHPNATLCWNCNPQDLNGQGFQYNFDLVKHRFGDTFHVRELDRIDYPYPALLENLAAMDYGGWILLECHTDPADKVGSMRAQRAVFDRMVSAL